MKSKKKDAEACTAVAREVYSVRVPIAIARALLAVASKDESRKALYRILCAKTVDGKTKLAATDTRVLLMATLQSDLGLPDGTYFHEVTPVAEKSFGRMMLSSIDILYPDPAKVLPSDDKLKTVGAFNCLRSDMFNSGAGRLQTNGSISINYRFLDRLCPAKYCILHNTDPAKPNYNMYVFDGEVEGWKLRYLVMGMTPEGPIGGSTP